MFRIFDGMLYEGKKSDRWAVTVRHIGHGHAEASARQAIDWQEVGPVSPEALAMKAESDAKDDEERKLRNLERAARRGKCAVRLKVKAAGMDAMLTLTYRQNQTDLALVKKHMYAFVRRMREAIPGWQYVAAFEPQKRGAWHVHMATHRLPLMMAASNGVKVKSFNVVRAIWRSVTGELGGNIDQQARKRWSKQTAGKMAAYLSKYMLKSYADGEPWTNRYSSSKGLKVPPATLLEFRGASLAELVPLLFDEIAAGACQCMTWLSGFGDCFFLSTERPPPR